MSRHERAMLMKSKEKKQIHEVWHNFEVLMVNFWF